jgi:uncharacterized membrane protein YwaF
MTKVVMVFLSPSVQILEPDLTIYMEPFLINHLSIIIPYLESTVKSCRSEEERRLLLGIVFDPKDGGHMFLRNVRLSPNYMTLQHRRPTSITVIRYFLAVQLASFYHDLGV